MSRQFYFVHVMKTAGGTFRRHLGRNFDRDVCYPPPVEEEGRNDIYLSTEHLQSLTPQERRRFTIVSGHYPYAARELLDDEVITLTLLRDPVERTISHIRLIQRTTPEFADSTLTDVYNDPMRKSFFFHNYQARVFAYDDPANPTAMAEVEWTPERVERARHNLAAVDALGFREELDDFITSTFERFGWTIHPGVRSKNVAEQADIDADLRAQIGEENRIDIEFYEWARALHEERRR